jgi:hypothetical protein
MTAIRVLNALSIASGQRESLVAHAAFAARRGIVASTRDVAYRRFTLTQLHAGVASCEQKATSRELAWEETA